MSNRSTLAALLVTVCYVGAIDAGRLDDGGHIHNTGHNTPSPRAANGQDHMPSYTRTVDDYALPTVKLTDSQGVEVTLSELLSSDRPILMQFIFTSCATICPLMSATFARGQSALTATHDGYRMLSISIDPEYDTPKRLAEYAKKNRAGDNWTFLTGSKDDIGQVMRAFNVLYQSDNKMYHRPYTFLRARSDSPWIRIDGFLTVKELVAEYSEALQSSTVTLN